MTISIAAILKILISGYIQRWQQHGLSQDHILGTNLLNHRSHGRGLQNHTRRKFLATWWHSWEHYLLKRIFYKCYWWYLEFCFFLILIYFICNIGGIGDHKHLPLKRRHRCVPDLLGWLEGDGWRCVTGPLTHQRNSPRWLY